jgi:shikimate dehydrogenase
MIYGVETPFLRWAKDLPASQKADGLGMLVEQAAIAFELWFDVKVETRSVLDQLRKQS